MQIKRLKLKIKNKIMNKFNNKEKGITLIALVITIIVLLILAGVSIAMLTGQNGILTQAQNAKTATEQASAKEKVELAVTGAIGQTKEGILTVENLKTELENYKGTVEGDTFPVTVKVDGKNFLVNANGKVVSTENSTLGIVTGSEEKNTTVKDGLGNQVVVPAGFKVLNPNDNVINGIVIEDVSHTATAGSQFVWIPVGEVIKDSAENKETITLSRYTFSDDSTGTPKDQGENEIENSFDSKYKHTEINTSTNGNITAKENIENEESGFRKSAKENHGYYIGRYETRDKVVIEERTDSSNTTNQIVCTANNYVYNFISQPEAAELSRKMYSDSNFESDLMNSYAWDTAVVFLQKFDNRANKPKAYSRQNSLNSGNNPASQGTNNLDSSKQDVICNVWDMASNCREWITETCSNINAPYTDRGGKCNDENYYTSIRNFSSTGISRDDISFRPIIYIN